MSSNMPSPASGQMPPIDDEPDVMPPIDDGVGAMPEVVVTVSPTPSVGVGRRAPVAAIASLLLLVGSLVLVTVSSFGRGAPVAVPPPSLPSPTTVSPTPSPSYDGGSPSATVY